MLHTKFGPVVFEKKILTHDGKSYSGDLKMFYSPYMYRKKKNNS